MFCVKPNGPVNCEFDVNVESQFSVMFSVPHYGSLGGGRWWYFDQMVVFWVVPGEGGIPPVPPPPGKALTSDVNSVL